MWQSGLAEGSVVLKLSLRGWLLNWQKYKSILIGQFLEDAKPPKLLFYFAIYISRFHRAFF